jgi:hypothetical protein
LLTKIAGQLFYILSEFAMEEKVIALTHFLQIKEVLALPSHTLDTYVLQL